MDQIIGSIESTTSPLPIFDKNLAAIYWVANTPSSLYKMMREVFFVRQTLSVIPSDILIAEFNRRSRLPIANSTQLAEIYAIYIALTFKSIGEVGEFFRKTSEEIRFEWFPDIATYFLNNYVPSPTVQILNYKPAEITSQEVASGPSIRYQDIVS